MPVGPESDGELVSACLAGDERAWAALIERHAGFLLGAIRGAARACGAPMAEQDAQDILQDALLHLLRDDRRLLRSYAPELPLRPWLAMLARARCLDALRRKGAAIRLASRVRALSAPDPARPATADPAGGPPDAAMREESARAVREALDRLPPKHRLIVRLFFVHGLKYREIGAATGVPVGTVGAILARTLAAMRKVLPDPDAP